MKYKRIKILVSATLLTSCLAGCAQGELQPYSDEDAATPPPDTTATKDYTYAFEKFGPEEAVLTVNGEDVSWNEYFYWIMGRAMTIEYYFGEVEDWEAVCAMDQTQTNREYVQNYAKDNIKQYKVMAQKADEMGVTIGENGEEQLQTLWESDIANYGGGDEQALLDYMETIFLTREIYEGVNSASLLYTECFEAIYGEEGADCPDEEVMLFAEENEYLGAKHILISKTNDAGEVLPDEELEEKRALAESLLEQLRSSEDPAALFDELMNESSEDPGVAYYPDGYTFLPGQMVTEFEEAAKALEDYNISDIVESDYGYHIVMKVPVTPDSIVEYASATEKYTMRYVAAMTLYDRIVLGWVEDAEVEYTAKFSEVSLDYIFNK